MATSQLMESQSQGYCSYTQPQGDYAKLLCGDDDDSLQRLEDLIRSHICFMNKSNNFNYMLVCI